MLKLHLSMPPILLTGLIILAMVGATYGLERFPPPDFETGYELPSTTTPPPRALFYQYLDLAVLIAALALASWFSLKKRSRRRLFGLMVFSLIYFGFWRKGCICPIGAIQNVTLTIFDRGYVIPVTVILFFVIPLIFTLFFGRGFCAAVCPLGAIQDVVLLKPQQLPVWLEHGLGMLAYVYLGAAVLFAATGSAFIICQYDPFVAFFRRSGSLEMLVLGVSFLVIALFIGRPYCRFLCPYGVILKTLSRFSRWKISITPAECIQCRLCEDSCPFNAIEKPGAAPLPANYRQGKTTLIILLILAPAIMALSGWLGYKLSAPFSRMHPTVRLAERVHLEETGQVPDTTDASDAFRGTGRSLMSLYEDAEQIGREYSWATVLLGVFIGTVIIIKLTYLTIRRTQTSYEADRGRCLACGRCFAYCPIEKNSNEPANI